MVLSETAGSFAFDTIARLLERLARQARATAHSPSVDHVHDLRLAVRRFEQSLVAFRENLPRREVKRIRRKLDALMDRAGAVRDCDVVSKLLGKCEESGVAELQEKLAGERKAKLPALAGVLRRWRSRRMLAKWRSALLPAGGHDAPHLHLPKLARKFVSHGEDAARSKVSARELHAFRIEAKKFRYTLELLEPLAGVAVRQWIETLQPIQSALGDIHDAWIARDIAAGFGASDAIEAWLKKRQRKKTREFRAVWEQGFGGASGRRLVAALRNTPRKPMGRSTAVSGASVRQA